MGKRNRFIVKLAGRQPWRAKRDEFYGDKRP